MNRVNRTYDDLLVLRDSGTPITATAAETGVEFAARKLDDYKAVIQFSGMDFTTTDETYVFSVGVSDVVGGTYTTIATVPDVGSATATGTLDIPLNGNMAEFFDADSAFIQVVATLGGTTPSIDYDCYLARN